MTTLSTVIYDDINSSVGITGLIEVVWSETLLKSGSLVGGVEALALFGSAAAVILARPDPCGLPVRNRILGGPPGRASHRAAKSLEIFRVQAGVRCRDVRCEM
jgi:hypothetical protein